MAECANYKIHTSLLDDQMELEMYGYNDKIADFAAQSVQMLKQMKDANLEHEFNQAKEKGLKMYKNKYSIQTAQQASFLKQVMLRPLVCEFKTMSDLLEPYTYEQFSQDLKTWLCTGRLVISVAGNISGEKSIEVAENVINALALKPVAVEDLAVDQVIRFKEGKTVTFEEPVRDTSNENSCAFVIYQDDFPETKLVTK